MSIGGEGEARGARRSHVLLVDDDRLVLVGLGEALRRLGFQVDTAESAEAALFRLERRYYPVIITDLAMPGLDGIDLIQVARRRAPHTRFIVLTGTTGQLSIPTPLRASVLQVLEKPSDAQVVAGLLRRALQDPSPESVPPPRSSTHGLRNRFLLVEDDDTDAKLIGRQLRATDANVCIDRARGLSEAIEMLSAQAYGLVLADLGLPDAEGVDAVIRLQHVAADAPLVVVSGIIDDQLALESVQAGAQDVIQKGSLEPRQLLQALRYAQERKHNEVRLAYRANHDPLTGLANRARLTDHIEHMVARAERRAVGFAVQLVDLDHFKPVNDQLGHAAGDAVLQQAARRIQQAAREADFVARLGGDEFVVVVEEIDDPNSVELVAERIRTALNKPFTVEIEATGEAAVRVSACIGVAVYPEDGTTGAALMRAADAAMYRAKQEGRDGYRFAQRRGHRPRFTCPPSGALGEALNAGRLQARYMPMVRAGQAGLECIEFKVFASQDGGELQATPIGGLEGPDELRRLTRWAITAACGDLRAIRNRAVTVQGVAVPLVASQLHDRSLVYDARRALQRYDIDPPDLVLLVPEQAVCNDRGLAMQLFPALKALGVRIVLDEFASGPASISQLTELPLDGVRICQTLVRTMELNPRRQALVRAIIAMCKQLSLPAMASAVDRISQSRLLAAAGCPIMQGALFGEAVLPDQVCAPSTEWVARPSRAPARR